MTNQTTSTTGNNSPGISGNWLDSALGQAEATAALACSFVEQSRQGRADAQTSNVLREKVQFLVLLLKDIRREIAGTPYSSAPPRRRPGRPRKQGGNSAGPPRYDTPAGRLTVQEIAARAGISKRAAEYRIRAGWAPTRLLLPAGAGSTD